MLGSNSLQLPAVEDEVAGRPLGARQPAVPGPVAAVVVARPQQHLPVEVVAEAEHCACARVVREEVLVVPNIDVLIITS